MTGWLFVAGVVVGWVLAEIRLARLAAALWERLKPQISNTAAPTTAELECPYPCPRCGSSRLIGHPDNWPAGRTCMECGWIRYADPYTGRLYDAPRQPFFGHIVATDPIEDPNK